VYLRRCYRRKDGKRHPYWSLVESYRTARGPPQRVVAYLGELDEQGGLGVRHAAQPDPWPQPDLFGPESGAAWVEVDLRAVRVERSRPFGGGWLGLMLLRQPGLSELLEELLPPGREEVPWSAMALVLVLADCSIPPASYISPSMDTRPVRWRSCWACRPRRSTTTGSTAPWIDCWPTNRL
jgi:hypothetical protein